MKKICLIILSLLTLACLMTAVACEKTIKSDKHSSDSAPASIDSGEEGGGSSPVDSGDSSGSAPASIDSGEEGGGSSPVDSGDSSGSAPVSHDAPAHVDGYNSLTIYWNNSDNLAKCDAWLWWESKEGSGYLFEADAYGAKCTVYVPEEIDEVGFIIRRNCSDPGGSTWGDAIKDYDGDRAVPMDAEHVEIYLKKGSGAIYYMNEQGELYERLEIKMAGMTDFNKVQFNINPKAKFTDISQFKLICDGQEVAITKVTGLNTKIDTATITTADDMQINKIYTLEIEGYGSRNVVPTRVFDKTEFKDNYLYDGDDLGATSDGSNTTFKVWAPTATEVILNLFTSGNEGSAYKSVAMTPGEKGVWSKTEQCAHGTYYTYTVTTSSGTQEAVDPYAKAVGLNGDRGMVVELEQTDPDDWNSETYKTAESYSDAIIWEVHVRDFSNKIASSQYKGKYLAFTEEGLKNSNGISVGIDYLKELGVTYVQLNPVYDYATVDESGSGRLFNWGYDPKNYNAPEGSYSTDPYNGAVRVNEFKQMVQALHAAGIGVVMDVVYNHTYAANSSLNKIVPYYYYRYNTNGTNSNGSGCGNETASDRAMYSKFMVDSVVYWATEYMIDGFRFDLMALHDTDTMQAIEKALHAVNPCALIYGEGWTGGSSTLGTAKQSTKANINKITTSAGAIGPVGVFNDELRDGMKGDTNGTTRGYINGAANSTTANKVLFGVQGGEKKTSNVNWTVAKGAVINYVACHDNLTLYDKLKASCPTATDEEIVAMNKLAASVLMVSKGMPFMLAGEEMLRTKNGDHNSYMSSDEINNIDWECLKEGSYALELMKFYKAVIALRKDNSFLRNADVTAYVWDDGSYMIDAYYYVNGNEKGRALINPNTYSKTIDASGYTVIFDGAQSVDYAGESTTTVPAKSVVVLKK